MPDSVTSLPEEPKLPPPPKKKKQKTRKSFFLGGRSRNIDSFFLGGTSFLFFLNLFFLKTFVFLIWKLPVSQQLYFVADSSKVAESLHHLLNTLSHHLQGFHITLATTGFEPSEILQLDLQVLIWKKTEGNISPKRWNFHK